MIGWKRKKSMIGQIIIYLMVFSLFSPASKSFAEDDYTPPTLYSLSISTNTATSGSTVNVYANITDNQSGIKTAIVYYNAPVGSVTKNASLHYNSQTGKYEGSFTIGPYDANGKWSIDHVYVLDNQGNYYFYYNHGYYYKGTTYEYRDLSAYDVNVTGTQSDLLPPTLNSLTVTPTAAKAGDTVNVSAGISDNLSGVQTALLYYKAPVGTTSKFVRLQYNSQTGKYEGSFTVGPYDAAGIWKIDHIYVMDNEENSYRYYNRGYTYKETTYEIRDLSAYNVYISGVQSDYTPPSLNAFSVSANKVAIGGSVNVSAEFSDNLSGIQYASVRFKTPTGSTSKSISLRYNDQTGKYEGSLTIGPNDAMGSWTIDYIYVVDNQNNDYYYYNRGGTNKGTNYEYRDLSAYDIVVGKFDQTAPITTIDLDSSSAKSGDWYPSNVTVSLNATDDQSGVNQTVYRINGGEWTLYTQSFDIQQEGTFTIEYKSTDKAGNEEQVKSTEVNIDKTAPVTTTSEVPTNWTNHNVAVALSAVDENSGIAKTEYQLNNGEWTDYIGPITSFAEGKNVVNYRSVDHAGNVEETKSVEVKIDKTAPTLNVSFDPSVLTDKNHQLVPIKATVGANDSISGVASVELVSIVSNQADNGNGDGNTTQDIQGADFGTLDTDFFVRAERSGSGDRIYTVTYKATDNAGNTTLSTQTIVVKHDNSQK